jgi:hypothetical protein
MEAIQYKSYTIQEDFRNPYGNKPEFMFYPTEEGIQDDADCDGDGFHYCGNCQWADTIEEAKDLISEKIMTEAPEHKVKINSREYSFPWIEDAVRFAEYWNGILLTPIESI